MKHLHASILRACAALGASLALLGHGGAVQAQSAAYYICPGNVFTNTISAREAETRGCKAREAGQSTVSVVGTSPRPRPPGASAGAGSASTVDRGPGTRVQQAEQRARDTDARRILEDELRKEEAALEALRKEYNNGEPERRGDERNAQKYLDRVAEIKAAITRKEADIAAIRRELSKHSS